VLKPGTSPPRRRSEKQGLGSQSLRGHSRMQLLLLRNPIVADRHDECLKGRKGGRAHASLNTQNQLSGKGLSAGLIFFFFFFVVFCEVHSTVS